MDSTLMLIAVHGEGSSIAFQGMNFGNGDLLGNKAKIKAVIDDSNDLLLKIKK